MRGENAINTYFKNERSNNDKLLECDMKFNSLIEIRTKFSEVKWTNDLSL